MPAGQPSDPETLANIRAVWRLVCPTVIYVYVQTLKSHSGSFLVIYLDLSSDISQCFFHSSL